MLRAVLASVLLAWSLSAPLAAAQEETEEAPSYRFLERQADLLFSYGKFDEAADSLSQACATDEGKVSLECHTRLANAAEKAGRVGLAIHAWELASVLGEAAEREAQAELDRLYSAYGRLLVYPPEGRDLPTRPLTLEHKGFLIDPKQKETLAAFIDRTQRKGITESTVWLPFGEYVLGDHAFEVTAGEASAIVLDVDDVPHQTTALRSEDAGFVALGGPRELFAGVSIGVLGTPTDGVGLGLMRIGGTVGFGGHLGPVRLQGRFRGSWRQGRSPGAPDDDERRPSAPELIGGVDVGVDVRLGGGIWLTPYLGALAGSFGVALAGCEAVQAATGHRWTGECALPAVGAGGFLGADLLILPAGDPRRVGIRIGLSFEGAAGRLMAGEGTPLAGLGTQLVSATPTSFVQLGGGLDVGVALRF